MAVKIIRNLILTDHEPHAVVTAEDDICSRVRFAQVSGPVVAFRVFDKLLGASFEARGHYLFQTAGMFPPSSEVGSVQLVDGFRDRSHPEATPAVSFSIEQF